MDHTMDIGMTEVDEGILEPEVEYKDIDSIMIEIGEYGRFQMIINIMAAIMVFPSAYHMMISYFAFDKPSWKCSKNSSACRANGSFEFSNITRCLLNRQDWTYVKPTHYSIVTQFDLHCDKEYIIDLATSSLFIGWLIGAIIIGWFSDKYGRRKPLFISVGFVILFGTISAFMPNIYLFIVCRFIIGFFIPGTFPQVMFTYLSEVVGRKYRAYASLSIYVFVGIALSVLTLKAYYIRNWKILYIACTTPYVFVLMFYWYVPESMRYLQAKGKSNEAIEVCRRIAKLNRKLISPSIRIEPSTVVPTNNHSTALDLFSTRHMAFKSVIQGIASFTGAMAFYALYLGAADISGRLYRDYLIVTIVEIPVGVLLMYLTERFGRKSTVMTSLMIGSLMCVGMGFIPKHGGVSTLRVGLAVAGKVSFSACRHTSNTWSVELYPTHMRGKGLGFVQVMARLGAAAAPWLNREANKIQDGASYIFIGVISFLPLFLLYFLPATKVITLNEAMTVDDSETELATISIIEYETERI